MTVYLFYSEIVCFKQNSSKTICAAMYEVLEANKVRFGVTCAVEWRLKWETNLP